MTAAETVRRAATRIGGADRILAEEEAVRFVEEQLAGIDADGRSVCVLVPDGTRSFPLPLLVRAVHRALHAATTPLIRRSPGRPGAALSIPTLIAGCL